MKIPDSLENLPTNGSRSRVYGEPYRTADDTTVIPVSKLRNGSPVPLGVFVIHGGTAKWVPAVDADRIALIGVIIGLIGTVFGGAAMLRRPPWPDLSDFRAATADR